MDRLRLHDDRQKKIFLAGILNKKTFLIVNIDNKLVQRNSQC